MHLLITPSPPSITPTKPRLPIKPVHPPPKPVHPAQKPVHPAKKPARPPPKPARLEKKPARLEKKPARLEQKTARLEKKLARLEKKLARLEKKLARLEKKPTHLEKKLERLKPPTKAFSPNPPPQKKLTPPFTYMYNDPLYLKSNTIMQSKHYIRLNNELNTMDTYIFSTPEKQIELGLNADQLTQFQAYKNQFNNDITAYTDPARQTPAVTQKTSTDFKQISAWIIHLRTTIKINKKATLTDQDYASLFIHKDKSSSPHTIPKITPTLELEQIAHLTARITASHATTHDQGTRPSLPDRIDTIDWQWVINDIHEPIDTLIYTNHSTTKTATLSLTFDPSQPGQFCHIIARYGITTGKVGPHSPSLSFAIT